MGRFGRWAALAVAAWMLLSWPLACSEQHIPPPPRPDAPIVRVRLLAARDEIKVRATTAPTIKAESEAAPLKLNLPDHKLEAMLHALPSLRRPTISQLAGGGWVAVETIIDESVVREIIPQLKALGAEGIIEYPLNKVVH